MKKFLPIFLLIKNLLFIFLGTCVLIYSYYLWHREGYSFFPSSWGFLGGHKELGVIVPVTIGILLIAQAIWELNSCLKKSTDKGITD